MSFWYAFFKMLQLETNKQQKEGHGFFKSLLNGFLSTIFFAFSILFVFFMFFFGLTVLF